MDHLPTPLSASGSPIEVPFVADIPWDFLEFEGFPARHGFAVDDNGQLQLDAIDKTRLASLLQSWLYFGFLSVTLRTKVRKEDFCRMRPAYSTMAAAIVLDSTSLESLIRAWTKKIYGCSVLNFLRSPAWAKKIRASANPDEFSKRLRDVWRTCAHVAHHPIGRSHPIPEILLSIEGLCNTFACLSEDKGYLYRQETEQKFHANQGSVNLIARQMINMGWCRALVTHVSKEYDINTFYFISRTKPPQVPWISHEQCSDFHCIANHVRKTTYQNRHVTNHCSCELIHVKGESREKMIRIITKGGVPLINIKKSSSNAVELDVIEHKPNTSYVAISHVWSDGLGNPHSNALPVCQLRKLAKCLEQQTSIGNGKTTSLFWMDTLCIPPAEHGDPEYSLRLDCIDRMALIYAGAKGVFVLDYGLQQIRLSTCSYEEVVVHLVCCAWNQRCWTLQEGALGHSVSFQLADGIFDPWAIQDQLGTVIPLSYVRKQTWRQTMSDSMTRWWNEHVYNFTTPSYQGLRCKESLTQFLRSDLDASLRVSLQRIKGKARPQGRSGNRGTYEFAQAWNALRKRTTTMPEDTYVVLANLLGFHPSTLSSLRKEDRLRAIILNMEKIPQSLLYNTGERVTPRTYSGERWIPAKIGKMALGTRCYMQRHPNGFVIEPFLCHSGQLPGLIVVTPPITRESGPIWLRCSPVKGHYKYNPMNVWIRIDLFRPSSHTEYDPALYQESCILIDQFEKELLSNPAPRTSWSAALLHHRGPGRGCIDVGSFHATYDCPARVTLFPEPEPEEKLGHSLMRNFEKPPQKDNFDLFEQPPWREIPSEVCRVQLPRATTVQDDYFINKPRHMDLFIRKGWTKQVVDIDFACVARFPQRWKLIVDIPRTKDEIPLVQRPYPIYSFLDLRSNPILYAARILQCLAPLACVIIICGFSPKLLRLDKTKYMHWKVAIAFHCAYVIVNLVTISFVSALILWGIDYFHVLSFLLIGFWTFFLSAVSQRTMAYVSTLEVYVVGIPYAVCAVWTVILGHIFYRWLSLLGYRQWLLTFDRDWRPEHMSWWWRPLGLRESFKKLKGQELV